MAGKSWIKVRRGILEPKHRLKIGPAWYLYLYILDRANWEKGVIFEWTDDSAAAELEISIVTLRSHRRRLEDEGYIVTIQRHQRQEITINKWCDPRSNSKLPENGDNDGVKNLTPKIDNGDIDGVNDGYIDGSQNLTPLHRINITHNTLQEDIDIVSHFCEITGVNYAPGIGQMDRQRWYSVIDFLYKSGATDEIIQAAAKEHGGLFDPYSLIPYVSRLVKQVMP